MNLTDSIQIVRDDSLSLLIIYPSGYSYIEKCYFNCANQLLKQEFIQGDKLIQETLLEYDKFGNITRYEEKGTRSPFVRTYEYSDFDQQNNWQKCKLVFSDGSEMNYARQFFY